MLVLSCNTLHALDYSLFLRLSAGEVEQAVVEVDYDGATAGLYSTSYTYDKMGNPLRVSRYGLGTVSGKLTVPSKRLVDNLYYSYTGHHIRGIADRAVGVVGDGALDFASGGTAEEYEYDSNGNLGYDPDRGMAFTYDRNNMPVAIYSSRVVTGGKLGAMSKISSYSYDAAGVRQSVVHTIPATASGVVGGSIVAGKPERTMRRDYVGPVILLDKAVERILIPGGYIDGEGRYRFYLTDYQGNNRAVVDRQGAVVQRTDYYPYGLPLRQTSPDSQPYKYSGKEFDPINGLNTYDFHARAYHPASIVFNSQDIYGDIFAHLSPYCYCIGNPIGFKDPDGQHVVYNIYGEFLGVDNYGFQGPYIVMNEEDFYNGMPADVAWKHDVRDEVSDEIIEKIEVHYSKLKDRPDYDGVVTVWEGIEWAKKHPGAKDNPTPENMLYIDTSKLDFGTLSTSDFPKIGVKKSVNLFKKYNIINSAVNVDLLATVYALGVVNMILLDRKLRAVSIVNDAATDYDWNTGGDNTRQFFIKTNNFLFRIDPEIHGFKACYYGVGKLYR